MNISNYHDPTIINWNLDNEGKPISLPVENEIKQILNKKIILEGIPDEQYRINIDNFVEINIRDKIENENEFKCDYTYGVLYFHNNQEGQEININKYYSRGQFYFPASRIYSSIDSYGNITNTIQNLIDTSVTRFIFSTDDPVDDDGNPDGTVWFRYVSLS